MTALYRVAGDTNDTVMVTCGGVADLLGATSVEAHVWKTTAPASSTTLVAEIVDASARTVRVKLGSWITSATPEPWRLEVQVTGTWADGQTGPRTFPTEGGTPLYVRAAGG